MAENESITIVLSLFLIGAAIGTYTVENQTYTTIYNMSSDFKDKTDAVLTNIPLEMRDHISSINIMDEKKINHICKDKGIGCTNINVDVFGKITNADIYITNDYDNKCYNFEWVLYHEIGHIDDTYQNGNWLNYYGNDNQIEAYADNFANQYIKNNCVRR